MCVIIVNKDGKSLPQTVITKSVTVNPDGFGIYFLDTKELFKTMDMTIASTLLSSARPFIAHCRYATVGVKNIDNVHPFEVQEDAYLFHNGTVRTRPTDKDKSDSWALAQLISRYDPMGQEVEHILEMTDSRFCMVKDGQFKVFNQELWHEHEGVLYSKDNVLPDNRLVFLYGAAAEDKFDTMYMTRLTGDAYAKEHSFYTDQWYTTPKMVNVVDPKGKHTYKAYGTLFSGAYEHDLNKFERKMPYAKRTKVKVQLDGVEYEATTWVHPFPANGNNATWKSRTSDFVVSDDLCSFVAKHFNMPDIEYLTRDEMYDEMYYYGIHKKEILKEYYQEKNKTQKLLF